ncbi:MAG: NUDIX hydrolase [Rhodospirillaceae bacterium]|nr:NUDIX hydrolase [Rhodospirillaceae bacterium]
MADLSDPPSPAALADDEPLHGPSVRQVPDGDDRPRLVCPDCGFIAYENPKIVVGSVAAWQGRVLLCRRAIEPRTGFWTLPAGYLELNETSEAGALREAWEEARARLALDGLLAVYNIPRISQVQLIYRARLLDPDVAAGPESSEVGLFAWEDVPWGEIAFPTVHWALHQWHAGADRPLGPAAGNPASPTFDMRPGKSLV